MDLKDNGTFLALATTGLVAAVGEFSTRSRQATGVVSVIDQVGGPLVVLLSSRTRDATGRPLVRLWERPWLEAWVRLSGPQSGLRRATSGAELVALSGAQSWQ